ncbi:MAG TPA: DNA translocase FtsK [candidate division Zixibacteria bacterium]|nr:DNA translocase FtsK [candidate division Zixibacteria bacterium]
MANRKASQAKPERTFREILASSLLALFALWLFLSIIGAPPSSSFIPASSFNRFGGPAGAIFTAPLVSAFGYFAVFVPVLLMIFAVGRSFHLPLRKVLVLAGQVVAGHAILAGLLGLPSGVLSTDIVGDYGLLLSATMRSVFGGLGAYAFSITLFVAFVAVITRLDIRSTLSSAGKGISGARSWISARKSRKQTRDESSREEIFAKYSGRVKEEHTGGITGSLIPGEFASAEPPIERRAPETIEVAPEKAHANDNSNSNYMEFIPPPIRRNPKPAFADEKSAPPPPPPPAPAETIDPKKFARDTDPKPGPEKKRDIPPLASPFHDEEFEREHKPVIGHEPPLPEPVFEDKSPDIKSIYEKKPVEKATVSPSHSEPMHHSATYKYSPPPLDILVEPEHEPNGLSDDALHRRSQRLLETLRSFNVDGEIREICPGPVITRFELEPAVGVKVSRIANLADDIALALKAQDIRIVAPIPGKGAVGIEVPNDNMQIVRIKSEIAGDDFHSKKHALPLALGKRVDGSPAVADLTKMPHLLIAGSTGSGKSVCINSIITSLVYSLSPRDLRLVLIDPKRLELSVYKGIPHLAAPIVVEPKHASIALNWATEEMDARYKLLSEVGVRSIADYNAFIDAHPEREELEKLPFIVVIVDELADLMLTVAGEIEEPIARLAQMARAVGIHLIIATQRPSVDVITGLIKSNFPSRIAFKVRSKIDSRTILDMGGAERLLGRGDMLYLPSGYADPIRIHGCLITTEETERVVKYLRTFPNPFSDDMLDMEEQENVISAQADQDELFWEAAKIVVMYQQGSTSFLQRKLRIGYTRAGCIIDQLEMAGIVGPFQGSKAREVLVKDLDAIDEMKDAGVSV